MTIMMHVMAAPKVIPFLGIHACYSDNFTPEYSTHHVGECKPQEWQTSVL
jgi:hypothetical protein